MVGTAAAVSLLAQTPTIPERVTISDGKPVSINVRGDTRGLSLQELASASLIVRGRLRRVGSYLSKDNRHIWTTYELLPSRVIVDRNADHPIPGIGPPYVVTLYGGDVMISGIRAEVVDASRHTWSSGTDLLLFLVGAEDIGAKGLRPMGGASGMFEIVEGQRLKSLRRHAPDKQEIDSLTFDEVLPMVAQAAKR